MNRLYAALIALSLVAALGGPLEAAGSSAEVGLDEQLGSVIPGDAAFRDELGRPVALGSLFDKPTIIAPVYFHCMHTCPMLLTGLAEALGKITTVRPGRDYQVVALSFDERDTPKIAAEKKKNYLRAVRSPFPPEAWTFLTGDEKNIRTFTDAVGFTFQRDGHEFSHPVALIVVAPGGKIVRYLYGVTFLPFNVTMAITEAAEGKVGSTAGRVLTYCFSYDPLKQTYVFNVLKVVGTAMVLFVAAFFIYLLLTSRKKRSAG